MANSKHLIPIIRKWEGEYAGNIDGKICTMRGITLETYQAHFGKHKTCQDLKNISEEEWHHIFKKSFWDKWQADKIENQAIANLLVDWCWASGKYGITIPQQVLGVKVDGVVGDKTLAAINNHPNQEELFNQLWNRRKRYFESIAVGNKAKFLRGWLNRHNDFKFE